MRGAPGHQPPAGLREKTTYELDRVYLPLDALTASGAAGGRPRRRGAPRPPALLATLRALSAKTTDLLAAAKPLSTSVRDTRLALEIGVIQTLAESLNARLKRRDPLADKVHHTPDAALGVAAWGAISTLVWRLGSRRTRPIGA